MKNSILTKLLGASTVSLLLISGMTLPAQATVSSIAATEVTSSTDAYENAKAELLQRINAYRASNGLGPVALDSRLGSVAQSWSDKTATAGGFKHNPDFASQIPQGAEYVAEIIGAASNPEELMFGWQNSEEHNNVLLAPKATTIGLGYSYQDNPAGEYYSNNYATAIFTSDISTTAVATPVAPTFNITTYFIPAVTGVQYKVNGVVIPTGTYEGKELITVTAEALPGYKLNGTSSWVKDYRMVTVDPSPSVKIVTPIAPTFNPTNYDIPSITGIQYKVNGVVTPAGNYQGKELVNITAEALEGYVINGTASWSHDYQLVTIDPSPSAKIVTPIVPKFSSTGYTIPSTAGVQYKVNNVVKAAGVYSATGTVNITAEALEGFILDGTTSWTNTFAPIANPTIKTNGDILAIDTAGTLWNYGNLKTARQKIGTGWQNFSEFHLADWNQDGYIDIIAKHTNGKLFLYKARSAGGFNTVTLGSGWQNYTIEVINWNKKIKYPSIIAKNVQTGYLYNYTNNSGTGISGVRHIGSGWKTFDLHMVDWDKDGNIDVLAKNSIGQIILYRTNGIGQFMNEKRIVISRGGWNAFNSVTAVRNLGGNGTSGLLARNALTGTLWYYQVNKSSWAAPKAMSSGWKGYKIVNQ